MRDWLINSGIEKSKIDLLFSSYALHLCRDIANGSKHCTITNPSVDAKFLTVREYDPELRRLGSERTEVMYILASGDKVELFGLALAAMADIQDFLILEGLYFATTSVTCDHYAQGVKP